MYNDSEIRHVLEEVSPGILVRRICTKAEHLRRCIVVRSALNHSNSSNEFYVGVVAPSREAVILADNALPQMSEDSCYRRFRMTVVSVGEIQRIRIVAYMYA